MCPKDAKGITNSVDLDQTATSGAIGSGSTLFAQTWYFIILQNQTFKYNCVF